MAGPSTSRRRRRKLVATLLAALGLVACSTHQPTTATHTAAKAKPTATPAASVSPMASAAPGASTGPASPAAKPTATPVAKPNGALLQPSSAFRTLTGSVQLEAAYVIGQKAGQVISDQGGSVVQVAGAGGLVSNNSGNLISNNGGSIISDAGSGLVSNNGGALISDLGGALISEGGNGIVSNNSGGLVSNNGGGYWLLGLTDAASGAVAATGASSGSVPGNPQAGTVLPAAGMTLRIVDLSTGRSVPLGQDATGQPAYEVITNSAGAYQVYLPASSTQTTLRVQSAPIGATDTRLHTDGLVRGSVAALQLDEDTPQVDNYVRLTFAYSIISNLSQAPADVPSNPALLLAPAEDQDAIIKGWLQLLQGLKDAQVAKRAKADQLAIAFRIADLVIADVPVDSLKMESDGTLGAFGALLGGDTDPNEPTLNIMAGVFASIRAKIGADMRHQTALGKDPTAYFAGRDYLVAANATADPPYQILKPSDFNDFLIRAYIADPSLDEIGRYTKLLTVLTNADVKLDSSSGLQLASGEKTLFDAFMSEMYLGDAKGLTNVLALLKRLPPLPAGAS